MQPVITIKRTRSEARKAYWATIPKDERTKRLRKAAIIKNRNMTPKQRRAHAMMMVKARKKT